MRRRHPPALLGILAVLALPGCGATTLRLAAAPNLTSAGKPGFDATIGFGMGWPLDFGGRSRHYAQAQGTVGGGASEDPRLGRPSGGIDVDYIHWTERLDQRAGAHLALRGTSTGDTLVGVGPQVGLLPMVYQNDASWLVTQLCVGPELRGEVLWSHTTGALGMFSLPLLVELSFLAAGD